MTIVNMIGGGVDSDNPLAFSEAELFRYYASSGNTGSHSDNTCYSYYNSGFAIVANDKEAKLIGRVGYSEKGYSQSGYYRGTYVTEVRDSSNTTLARAIQSVLPEGKTFTGTLECLNDVDGTRLSSLTSFKTVEIYGDAETMSSKFNNVYVLGRANTYDSTVGGYLVPITGTITFS